MYIAAVFMLVFTVAQFLICRHISGWPKLARQFRAVEPPAGTRFRSQSGKVGNLNIYRGGLRLHVGPQGLHMRFTTGPSYADLLLPWSSLTDYREVSSWGMRWGECLIVTKEGSVRLRLARAVWVAAAPYLPQFTIVTVIAPGRETAGPAFCTDCGCPLSRTAVARFCMKCGHPLTPGVTA